MDAKTYYEQYNQIPCTPRMIQAMQLLALGKTLDQAALIMGVSMKSVNRHLARAKERLGAETRPQLVARAVALGLILVTFQETEDIAHG
jgi:DNA-binding CsgD family transcriptional regulator